jgi:hypothetical protein
MKNSSRCYFSALLMLSTVTAFAADVVAVVLPWLGLGSVALTSSSMIACCFCCRRV